MKKRIVSLVLIFALITSSVVFNVSAAEVEAQRIDLLFSELNEIATQEAVEEKNAKDNVAVAANIQRSNLNYANQKKEIYNELKRYGVNLVDPNDTATVSRLNKIVSEAETMKYPTNTNINTRSATPLDFSAFASMYDITEQTTIFSIDGELYESLCLTVTYNEQKTGRKLNEHPDYTMNEEEVSATFFDFLDYAITFGVEEFYGTFHWPIRLAIGSWFEFSVDYDYDEPVLLCGEQYEVDINSVIQLRYYYLYLPGLASWVQCGATVSNCTFARTDTAEFTVGGIPENDSVDYPAQSVTKTINRSWSWYVNNYVETRADCADPMGTIEIEGFDVIKTFNPGFYYTFSDLVNAEADDD